MSWADGDGKTRLPPQAQDNLDYAAASIWSPKSPPEATKTAAPTNQARNCAASACKRLQLGFVQYQVDAGLILCKAGTLARLGLPFTLGLLALLGKESLVVDIGVPRGLPDSPNEVFNLTARDGKPQPPLWAEHACTTWPPGDQHAITEPHEPRVVAWLVPPRAVRIARDGYLQFDKLVVTLVDSADSGDRAWIVAEGILVGHAHILPDAPTASPATGGRMAGQNLGRNAA